MSLLPDHGGGYYDETGHWQRLKFCFVQCAHCTCQPPGGLDYNVLYDKSKELPKRGGPSSEGEPSAAATGETGSDRPAAPISIGDRCPTCASGRISPSGVFLRCNNCGWLRDPDLHR